MCPHEWGRVTKCTVGCNLLKGFDSLLWTEGSTSFQMSQCLESALFADYQDLDLSWLKIIIKINSQAILLWPHKVIPATCFQQDKLQHIPNSLLWLGSLPIFYKVANEFWLASVPRNDTHVNQPCGLFISLYNVSGRKFALKMEFACVILLSGALRTDAAWGSLSLELMSCGINASPSLCITSPWINEQAS